MLADRHRFVLTLRTSPLVMARVSPSRAHTLLLCIAFATTACFVRSTEGLLLCLLQLCCCLQRVFVRRRR